jgi:3',5'-cyclic AMP phosphodiesterase CpdA
VGIAHPERPYVSRREFLRRAGILSLGSAFAPWLWKRLAYAADAPATQRHLTFGADPSRTMTVSWLTSAPVRDPFVESRGVRVPARTVQYAGYPGFIHHASLEGLEPGRSHGYQVGHGDQVVTSPAAFRTAPGEAARFRFTVFGDQGTDLGAGIPPVSQPPNQASANVDLASSFSPAFHLIVGDLAYANGDQDIWDSWFRMIEPMAHHTPWMPSLGNHEIESGLDFLGQDSWGKWGYDPYRTRLSLPPNGHTDLENCFYGFRYGSVHVLMLDNNDVNDEIRPNIGYTEGRQRAWVARELAAARQDPAVDFIVVGMHQCAFSSSTKHGSDPGVQEAWFDLFREHQVDLVFQGHDHVYERTHGMRGVDVAHRANPYRTDQGTVFVTCGNGGAIQEVFQPEQPEWSAFRQHLKVGTLLVDVDPFAADGMARLTLGEYWALDGSPIEEGIVLERPRRTATAQTSPRRVPEAAPA